MNASTVRQASSDLHPDPSAGRARRLWHVLEPINAVTYFAPECRAAMTECGLRGFWMGYFAARAAPLGAATASTVEATFFNFHPDRVRRAIPAGWAMAAPADVVEARQAAAAAALRRLVPSIEALEETVSPLLAMAMEAAPPGGRPLFAANRDVPTPDDPVAALWQLATTMREHRGDGTSRSSSAPSSTVARPTSCSPPPSSSTRPSCRTVAAGRSTTGRRPPSGWSPVSWSKRTARRRRRGGTSGRASSGAPTSSPGAPMSGSARSASTT